MDLEDARELADPQAFERLDQAQAGTANLEITDNGIGTDTASVAGRLAAGHIGLNSHRVKIESAGGQFRLDTPASGGTRIRISVPAQQSGQ